MTTLNLSNIVAVGEACVDAGAEFARTGEYPPLDPHLEADLQRMSDHERELVTMFVRGAGYERRRSGRPAAPQESRPALWQEIAVLLLAVFAILFLVPLMFQVFGILGGAR